MGDVVKLRPQPSDKEIEDYLQKQWKADLQEHNVLLEELKETIKETENAGHPVMFAYGKMMNKFHEFDKDELVHMLAAATWELA